MEEVRERGPDQQVGERAAVEEVLVQEPALAGEDPKAPSAEYGALVYKAKLCNSCHALDGTRVVGPSWKGIYGKKEQTSAGEVTVDDAYIKESILQPLAKVVTGYPPAMPPQALTSIQIESVILFIKAQQ